MIDYIITSNVGVEIGRMKFEIGNLGFAPLKLATFGKLSTF